MEIRKSKETLVLTRVEKAILLKARNMLDEICKKADPGNDMGYWAEEARNHIDYLSDDTEVEGGEPIGAINVTILI